MASETKTCQNCHRPFTIESDDFGFYEKINVPPPTWCPDCRLMRRLAVRNERSLYNHQCGLCGKKIISMYSPDKPFPVYCSQCWWGDGWDPLQYGREYDFSKSFFQQFRDLQNTVPRPHVRSSNIVNSDYCNYFADGKNCYLCFGSIEVEDCLYGSPYSSKYCVDTFLARECEYCYEAIDCEKLSNCMFVQDCSNSFNLVFCFDCKSCQDCIGCVGLHNKQYHIFNQPYAREEYQKKREEIVSGDSAKLEETEQAFNKLKLRIPHRFATVLQSTEVSGDHIVQSRRARQCFDTKRSEDAAYCNRMTDGKDSYDINYCEYLESCYEYLGFWKMKNSFFCNTCGESSDLQYSDFCSGCQNLFGCVSLRHMSCCILNKQYSKEEYNTLVAKIKKHMGDMPYRTQSGIEYRYGEYFPVELSILNYNETIAQEYFPLTEERTKRKGYGWQPPVKRNYKITVQDNELPKKISLISDGILNEIIGCAHQGTCNQQCTTAFKITPSELQFYKRMQLPLPRLCSNCRHYERLAKRNPFKLWDRTCAKCDAPIKTSYAPDRPEIVYCESCYQQEVI